MKGLAAYKESQFLADWKDQGSGFLGHVEQRVLLPGVFVGDVFNEQQNQHVVLVLGGVHAPAKFVAAFPERAVELGLLDGHGSECLGFLALRYTGFACRYEPVLTGVVEHQHLHHRGHGVVVPLGGLAGGP